MLTMMTVFEPPLRQCSNYSTDTLIFDSQFHARGGRESQNRPDPVTSNHAMQHTPEIRNTVETPQRSEIWWRNTVENTMHNVTVVD